MSSANQGASGAVSITVSNAAGTGATGPLRRVGFGTRDISTDGSGKGDSADRIADLERLPGYGYECVAGGVEL